MTKEKCKKCDSENVVLVEYDYTDPDHYDGISEIKCRDCGARFGRWTGKELAENETEPRYGINNSMNTKDWEKSFEEFWPDWGKSIRETATTATEILMAESEDNRRDHIKSFIRELLAKQREEIVEEIEKITAVIPLNKNKVEWTRYIRDALQIIKTNDGYI